MIKQVRHGVPETNRRSLHLVSIQTSDILKNTLTPDENGIIHIHADIG